MSDIVLTEEQQNAVNYIIDNIKTKKQISMGGYGGTGKSTCLKFIAKKYPNFAVCAFTGKACNVLRRKGIPNAETIHSTIYDVKTDHNNQPVFTLKSRVSLGYSGFIVDEASMVSEEIYDNMKYFNLPIIFIGDHGQLEPVGTKFNLIKSPNVKLEKIHRNANNIAKFADFLRKDNGAINYKSEDTSVSLTSKKLISIEQMMDADQIICAFNKTRLNINNLIRSKKGYDSVIHPGEKIICLKNNRELSLFNGMQVVVEKVFKNNIIFKNDKGREYNIKIDTRQFGNPTLLESANQDKSRGYFDYAYAITCHKAQGDEWDNIIVLEEKCDLWEHKRWAYTAASRARKNIIWACG